MPSLSSGQNASLVLAPGDSYTISTTGGATVKGIYGAPSNTTTLAANFAKFGPYGVPAKLDIACQSGTANYALEQFVGMPVTAQTDPVTGRLRVSGDTSAPELPTYAESQALNYIATGSTKTKLYKSSNGASAGVSAYITGMAVGLSSGDVATIDSTGVPHVYSSGRWVIGPAIGAASSPRIMFVSSLGYVFAVPAGGGKVFRSIDGGMSYTQVAAFTFSDEDSMSMTEDDQGTLWTHSYAHATKSVELLKSTNAGASWVDVAGVVRVFSGTVDSGTLLANTSRHIHDVYWCPHRSWLFVTHGDAGSKSPVLVSDDRGATFRVWGSLTLANNFVGSVQATVLVTDAKNIYYRADLGIGSSNQEHDFGIYVTPHAAGASLESLLASTPVKRWAETRIGCLPVDGWSSNGGVTPDGIVWFSTNSALNYSGKVLASADNGGTWDTILTTAPATGGAYGSFAAGRAYHSKYAPQPLNAMLYGNSSDESSLIAFKVLPILRNVRQYEGGLSKQWNPVPEQVIKVYADFESLPTPSSTGGDTGTALNLASAGPSAGAFTGSKCAKFSYGGSGSYSEAKWNNVFNGYAAGSDLIIDSRVYVESAALTGNLGNLHVFSGGSGYIYVGCAGNGAVKVGTAGVLTWGVVGTQKERTVPLNRWFWLRTVVTAHPTTGSITVLIDGAVALRATGIPTIGDDMYSASIGGNLGGGWVGNVYFDNLAISVTPAANIPARIEAGGEY